jgi:hypothetical protein
VNLSTIIQGKAYVLGDNIDTDQIIPAQYLTLVPTIQEEYEKLGSFALIGLPDDQYPKRFVEDGKTKTEYKIVIAGRNFGCGSSREHAPIAMGAAGVDSAPACAWPGGVAAISAHTTEVTSRARAGGRARDKRNTRGGMRRRYATLARPTGTLRRSDAAPLRMWPGTDRSDFTPPPCCLFAVRRRTGD